MTDRLLSLPELCLIKVISFLGVNSIDTLLEYFRTYDKNTYNNLIYRINHIIRNSYPFTRVLEVTHCYINSIKTKKDFMDVYSYLFNSLRTSERRLGELENNVVYDKLLNKLLEKDTLKEKEKTKFEHLVFNKHSVYSGSKLNKISVKIDGIKCFINIKNLDDYLSLEISYQNYFHC